MTQETIQAADFEKKPYAAPEIRAYQVKVTNIIATSPSSASANEEYGIGETTPWF